MIAPVPSLHHSPPETPVEALEALRGLFERDPLATHDGPETLSARTGVPAWAIEAALEALTLDGGEITA